VTTEENQLVVRGRQTDDTEREFLHRGIAARQFQRCFVLADGMRVIAAELKNGLLSIDLDRPESVRLVRKINISVKDCSLPMALMRDGLLPGKGGVLAPRRLEMTRTENITMTNGEFAHLGEGSV